MIGILYIAAKAPRPGLAKTRLGAQIGGERATALYRAFLRDIARQFSRAPFPVGWYITPLDGWPEINAATGNVWPRERLLIQPDGDWTYRQRELFRRQTPTPNRPIILIASDSPQVTIGKVADAFRLLERHDVVLGPVTDGGYWLIGMRSWLEIFDGVSMSTAAVVDQIAERAGRLGASLGYAASTFDIDTLADLQPLIQLLDRRNDLPATRFALESLGLVPNAAALPDQAEPLLAGSTNGRSIADGG